MFDGEAWAAGEIVVFMVIAGLIGFAIGWILGRWSQRGHIAADYEEKLAAERERASRVEDRLNQSSRDLAGVQLQVKGGEGRIDELAAELASAKETLAEQEAALAAVAGKDAEIERLEAEVATRESTADEELTRIHAELEERAGELAARAARIAELEAELAAVPERGVVPGAPEQGAPAEPASGMEEAAEAAATSPAPSQQEGLARMAEIASRSAGEGPVADDDLKKIRGIGPVIERTLKSLGITSFKQIANFGDADIAYVSAALDAFPGRIERDDWMGSAAELHAAKYGRPA